MSNREFKETTNALTFSDEGISVKGNNKNFVILDGAVGTEIQKICDRERVDYPIPEMLNFTHPEIIEEVIRSYAKSGSDMVCANTFGTNRYKLEKYGKTVDETIKKAVEVAKSALRDYPQVLIGLDCSTTGKLIEPSGTLKFEEAYDVYCEIMTAASKHGADFIIIETMTDLYETKAALLAAKENTSLPVICSMSFEKSMRTFTGCSASAMALTLEGLGADAIGVNCSLGPAELIQIVEELLSITSLPVMVKPNAGLPDPETGAFSLSADDFALQMKKFAQMGVKFLGGCCGTNPEFIAKLKKAVEDIAPAANPNRGNYGTAICSHSKTVLIDGPQMVGERINPTGKKRFKQALIDNDIDYILGQAIEQVEAGADILDVNVGLPEINEPEMMVRVIKALQAVVDVPLQIDSTNPEVIEAALRVYNGKAIVNSVNGEPETWKTIFPLIKKYGACVLGLTLDKNGIPKKAEARFKIAEQILNAALSYGIPKKDVFVDCLTLTVSAEQESADETLKAVRMVKERLGLKTVLGVSNISFGLPSRELVNHTFLALALENGLDLPIINPNIQSMSATVRSFRVLKGFDKNSTAYIEAYAADKSPSVNSKSDDVTLEYAILKGLKSEAKRLTEGRLSETAAMEVVEKELIPALDKVGALFEQGKLFLPQLILSADTAGLCFDVIKKDLNAKGGAPVSKGEIVLATVHGDIHDIGKNIVKVLLENYGYQIIDLGKDVPEQVVVDAVRKHDVRLAGLSALMTTTLPAMEKTIRLLKEHCPYCRIMVGGAVLTEDYALKIGADFYAADAGGAVSIAKKLFK